VHTTEMKLKEGGSNIFKGGLHWTLYCYRGPRILHLQLQIRYEN